MPLSRRQFAATLGIAATGLALPGLARPAIAQPDPLPSWNDGPAKAAIHAFIQAATASGSPGFVPPAQRIATFDNDGTLWVEQPLYTQLVFCFARVPEVTKARPELAGQEPFRTVLSGDKAAIAALHLDDLIKIAGATLSGMSVDAFADQARQWLATARDPRWNRPYTELIYQPMLELLRHLRANGFRTWIVTGGGQDFVRAFAETTYGVPPEQVVGSAAASSFGHDAQGRAELTKTAKLLLNDDGPGKPEGIHLMIGRKPQAAFGNSSGDRDMIDYATTGPGPRLGGLVLHDDAAREYAYGPARGLPESRIGTFPQALADEANKRGWQVISMKNDWKRIFAFA